MLLCEVCGNELVKGTGVCPFCRSRQDLSASGAKRPCGKLHKTVNLEQGMPFVEQALKRLQAEIDDARQQSIAILTIIHGYGSSGKGGAIKIECRKLLEYLVSSKVINMYLPGEIFNKREKVVKTAVQRYPALTGNKNYNRNNPGITVVIL